MSHVPHSLEHHSLALPAAVSATSKSAAARGYGTVSTLVIGLFTLITTLLALYLIARRSRDDHHRGDE